MESTVDVDVTPRLSLNIVIEGGLSELNKVLRAVMNEVDESQGLTVKYVTTTTLVVVKSE